MKKIFAFVLVWTLILSLTACGGSPSTSRDDLSTSQNGADSPQGGDDSNSSQDGDDSSQDGADASQDGVDGSQDETDSSQSGTDTSQGESDATQGGADASQNGSDATQGEPEDIDLDKMAEIYSADAEATDQLSGKTVNVTGYIKLNHETDELYLWGWFYHNYSASINIVVKLSEEDEALLRSEDFFLARVTLTGRIDEGMRTEKSETSETTAYWYTMSDASYITNIHEVTGILNKSEDGIYWIEGVGDIRFLDKDNIPPVGTEVTLSGKISYGGDFREAVVVE